MVQTYLDFEKPVAEIEQKIRELGHLDEQSGVNVADEVERLRERAERLLRQAYARLSPWQKTQVARHPERPHFIDYANGLFEGFMPLAGDRCFAEDPAILGGPAWLRGRPVMLMGHEKGADTEARVRHNFGMARPEGYRKAVRLMRMAERFGLPLVALVDTAGAYPGIEAEARGQAEAIARAIETGLSLTVPSVAVIIGEGGSGGAIALAVANRVIMLEHAIYSVISPEGCASILWRSADYAQDAADALKLTAQDLLKLGVIDEIVPEAIGGAHRAREASVRDVGDAIARALDGFGALGGAELRRQRREKFIAIGKAQLV